MELQEFIETFATIDNVGQKEYGHHPFAFFYLDKDGGNNIGAMMGQSVLQVYDLMAKAIQEGATLGYFTLDFAPKPEIAWDFILVVKFEGESVNVVRIMPYDKKKGEWQEVIKYPVEKENHGIWNAFQSSVGQFFAMKFKGAKMRVNKGFSAN